MLQAATSIGARRIGLALRASVVPSPPPSDDGALSSTAIHGPDPSLSPADVVLAQLELLQRGDNEALEECWKYVSPYGPLTDVHHSSAGPCARFKWTIKREPRWRQIGSRPMAALYKLHRCAPTLTQPQM